MHRITGKCADRNNIGCILIFVRSYAAGLETVRCLIFVVVDLVLSAQKSSIQGESHFLECGQSICLYYLV